MERRMQWFESLNMQPVEECKAQKLRVCHKHFRDIDYSCSPKHRFLLNTAIPSIHVPRMDDINATENAMDLDVPQQIPQIEHHENIEKPEDTHLKEIKEMKTQLHEVMLQQQQHAETLMQQGENMHQIMIQQEEQKISLEKEITDLKQKLNVHLEQTHARPDLEEISRKKLLTPRARRLYNKTVKLKRDKRHLKRLINRMKVEKKSNKVTLRTKNQKAKVDDTVAVRQQFINMILRNNDVAPQVKSQNSTKF